MIFNMVGAGNGGGGGSAKKIIFDSTIVSNISAMQTKPESVKNPAVMAWYSTPGKSTASLSYNNITVDNVSIPTWRCNCYNGGEASLAMMAPLIPKEATKVGIKLQTLRVESEGSKQFLQFYNAFAYAGTPENNTAATLIKTVEVANGAVSMTDKPYDLYEYDISDITVDTYLFLYLRGVNTYITDLYVE